MPLDVSEYIFGLQRISDYHGCERKHIIGYFFDKSTADRAAARIAFELSVAGFEWGRKIQDVMANPVVSRTDRN